MEITKFDISLIFSLSIGIVILSFAAPALGLTSENSVNASDIPEFEYSGEELEGLAGGFPDGPGTPNRVELVWYNESFIGEGISQKWIDGDTDGGTEVFITNEGTDVDPIAEITVNQWETGSVTGQDEYQVPNDDTDVLHNNGSYTILFTFDFCIANQSGCDETVLESTGDVTARDDSDSGGLIGGLFSLGSDIASTLAWFGEIVYWFVLALGEATLTVGITVSDVAVYLFDLANWLITTYSGIIDGAEGFASAVVTLPLVLLFFELAKLVIVAASLLPGTG